MRRLLFNGAAAFGLVLLSYLSYRESVEIGPATNWWFLSLAIASGIGAIFLGIGFLGVAWQRAVDADQRPND